jgi:hypothetical protein
MLGAPPQTDCSRRDSDDFANRLKWSYPRVNKVDHRWLAAMERGPLHQSVGRMQNRWDEGPDLDRGTTPNRATLCGMPRTESSSAWTSDYLINGVAKTVANQNNASKSFSLAN